MQNDRGEQNPKRLEDQQEFGGGDRIQDDEAIGDAAKRLWPCQAHEQEVAIKPAHPQ